MKKIAFALLLTSSYATAHANTEVATPITSEQFKALLENPVFQTVLSQALNDKTSALNQSIVTALHNPKSALSEAVVNHPQVSKLMVEQDQLIQKATEAQETKFKEFSQTFDTKLTNMTNSFSGNDQSSALISSLAPIAVKAMGFNADNQYVKNAQQQFDRHVYFTTTAGYQWASSASKKNQEQSRDVAQQDDMITNFALGLYVKGTHANRKNTDGTRKRVSVTTINEELKAVNEQIDALTSDYNTKKTRLAALNNLDKKNHQETADIVSLTTELNQISEKITPEVEKSLQYNDELNRAYRRGFAVQGEYSEVRAKTTTSEASEHEKNSAQKNFALVGLVPVPFDFADKLAEEHNTHLYGIVGTGYSTFKADAGKENNTNKSNDVLGIVGVGYSKDVANSATQIIGEARMVYSTKDNYWQPQVMAGIRVGIAKYLSSKLF